MKHLTYPFLITALLLSPVYASKKAIEFPEFTHAAATKLHSAPANTFDCTTDVVCGLLVGSPTKVIVSGQPGSYNVEVDVRSKTGEVCILRAENFPENSYNTLQLFNSQTGANFAVDCDSCPMGLYNSESFEEALKQMFGLKGLKGKEPIEFVSSFLGFPTGMSKKGILPTDELPTGMYGLYHNKGEEELCLTNGFTVWKEALTGGAQKVKFRDFLTVELSSAFNIGDAHPLVRFAVKKDSGNEN